MTELKEVLRVGPNSIRLCVLITGGNLHTEAGTQGEHHVELKSRD